MSENPVASEWIGARGAQWAAQLSGMESMLEPVHEPLLGALKLEGPCRIAEIGSGGGGTALEILRRAPAGSTVHGFDISPTLVARARERLQLDERAVAFEVSDMATATPERPYERLVSRFGVMFFDDPGGAFTNLRRWLSPGGRFAFAVWGRPSDNLWITSVREVVAEIVDIPPPLPDAPGPFRYADADKLTSLLDQAGFTGLDVRDWRGALPVGGELDPAEAARFALSSFASFGELLAQAGGDALTKAHQSLTARFAPYQRDGAVRLPACVRLFTGTRR